MGSLKTAVVTGGAGFIGRWVVKRLLELGKPVLVVDDLSSGSASNLSEFEGQEGYLGLCRLPVHDRPALVAALPKDADVIFHLAARINVQASIDNPRDTFERDVVGTFGVLEWAREQRVKVVLMSTCMVYAPSPGSPMTEHHPVLPASPYAACKLSCEHLALSYHKAYHLPVTVLRPFNTYGPFQRSDGEGGVVSIFLRRRLAGAPLVVFGDGAQTRDLLYVEDCASFVVSAGLSAQADGQVLNAGTGTDISILALARLIGGGEVPVVLTPHPHPQAEIPRLICDPSRARDILGWRPKVELAEGLERTRNWIRGQLPAQS